MQGVSYQVDDGIFLNRPLEDAVPLYEGKVDAQLHGRRFDVGDAYLESGRECAKLFEAVASRQNMKGRFFVR